MDLDNSKSVLSDLVSAWTAAAKNSLALAIPINMFNHVSVVGCRFDKGFWESTRMIYDGIKPELGQSVLNFGRGLTAHFSKEVPRATLNALNFYHLSPWLYDRYEPRLAALGVSISAALAEVLINPFDTWRVNIQAGERLVFSLPKLYAGSFLGGSRLFLTWQLYGETKNLYQPWLTSKGVDPHSISGILLLSAFQSVTYTPLVYPLERIKNHLQYRKGILDAAFGRKTLEAMREVVAQQSRVGLWRGCLAKIAVNTCFAFMGSKLHSAGSQELAL